MESNQVLAVWGNPNSGKTITSIKIARELALKKKNVIIVMCDTLCPQSMLVLPSIKSEKKSLGSLLSSPNISQDDILSKCITLRKNKYISILGYEQGENIFTYAQYSKERAVDLLILLRHLAEYVIVDCSSVFTSDILSTVALEMADKVIRLTSGNLKTISYFDSYLPLLADRRFNVDSHIKVLSDVKNSEPKEQIKEKYYGIDYELPHFEEISEQFLCGELFEELKSKGKEEYNATIRELITLIFDKSFQITNTSGGFLPWFRGGKK